MRVIYYITPFYTLFLFASPFLAAPIPAEDDEGVGDFTHTQSTTVISYDGDHGITSPPPPGMRPGQETPRQPARMGVGTNTPSSTGNAVPPTEELQPGLQRTSSATSITSGGRSSGGSGGGGGGGAGDYELEGGG